MERTARYIPFFACILAMAFMGRVFGSMTIRYSDNHHHVNKFLFPPDTIISPDTTGIQLPFPFEDEGIPYNPESNTNPLYLQAPSNISTEVEYNPSSGLYILQHKIGDLDYRPPTYMSLEDYRDYDLKNSVRDYWKERAKSAGVGTRSGIIPSIYIGGAAFDRIFGGNTIDIRPSGMVELQFGLLGNSRDDPTLDIRQRRQINFDFRETIQMNVIAKIGDKIEFKTNYNTQATFDFENKLNLRYEGDEDEILQLIEAGNVNLPLTSTLITGSQSLFGIKTKLKFGKATVTAIYSEQESETSSVTVQGGAQLNEFQIKADEYEENKHFLLAHFFRDNYEFALQDLPIINSGINITKIEVWITNIGAAVTQNRNIVAFTDLGENYRINADNLSPNPQFYYPDNRSNDLFSVIDSNQIRDLNKVNNHLIERGFVPGEDFEKIELAKRLESTEYTFNSKLGFISLNTILNPDQTLAVAYQYQLIGSEEVYQVGEFSDEGITGQNCLVVKLLKSTYVNIRNPRYDLMMKNIYPLGAYQVNSQDFTLNILYSGDDNGVPTGYFNEGPDQIKGKPLVQVFNLDNLDAMMNRVPDGVFDYLDNAATQGGTINSANGRIFFTVLEPFGSYLRGQFEKYGASALADKYCYDSLYTLTKTGAQQYAEKNKYLIEGFYKSASGSEISLNAINIPQGSVKVTAGGVPLTENVDYTVDYTLGRVRIINEGIMNSGTPIRVSLESNTLFSIQTKKLMGAHLDYEVNRDFHLGATVLNLSERPLTQKVNYGDDPISNTIWGMDYSYQTESRMITRIIDKLPLLSTAAPSSVTIDGEFAHFLPGHSRAIGKEGTSYIDDFEATKSTIDMRNFVTWFLASTPQNQPDLIPEGSSTYVDYGYNRAKMSWYVIDPTVFYDRNSTLKPPNVTNDELSNHYVRQILETEVFPNKDIPNGTPTNIAVLNVAFYPEERGPYNYDTERLREDGTLDFPEQRWGGIMRQIETTDFESTNIEYIEFWMMDPFADGSLNDGSGGELYFNLGDISEDILKDSRKSYEHGLPISGNVTEVDTTIWGRVPDKLDLVQSFSNEAGAREYQDVGYDGLRDEDELTFFSEQSAYPLSHPYLDLVRARWGESSDAYQQAAGDPSGDNYHNFRGDDYDANDLYGSVLERYKDYNSPDGNSPENVGGGVYDGNTRQPNMEDLNGDNTLSEAERYYQYKIVLKPGKMNVGENYITDVYNTQGIPLANGELGNVRWYQFKIPVRSPDKVVGNISDFKSIRFMRMFTAGFFKPVVLRFATLDLVRGEWRRYPVSEELLAPGEYIPNSTINETSFDISAVNIEENGQRTPIPYVIPPGIDREITIGTTNLTRLNEQSMVMKVCDLADGDVAAGYKTADFDFRQFKRLRMFVHAEKSLESDQLKYGDLTLFIRIGSDFTRNYYEYEVPLTFTPWYTSDPEQIWPVSNEVDIDLEKLVNYKLERNTAMRQSGSNVSLTQAYYAYDGSNRVTVLGSPSISDVKAILIGVRNPKKTEANPDDSGEPMCAEIWVNELRLTEFNKKGGWAATSRVAVNLADLGNMTISGMYSSPWFGSIEQKITDIQLESATQFDFATNIELGKFLPEKAGVRVPMHFDYSQTHVKPEFNPLDPDLHLDEVIDSYETKEEKQEVRSQTQDYTQRKNINFINVRKDKVGTQAKSRPWDIENFDLSYSYSEIYHRNVDIEYDMQKTRSGGIGYNFNAMPKPVKPFAKIGFISNIKAFQLIKDFNFFYLPKMFSFRTDMNRVNNERKLRKKSIGDVITYPTYFRTWDWNRTYDFKYDLSQSLAFTLNARANSFINEPGGSLKKTDPDYAEKKEQIWNDILSGGTMNTYNQTANVSYNVPVNKLPLMDWVTLQAGYQTIYGWTGSPLSIRDTLGNTVQNSRGINLNGNIDLSKLYNKIGYLKKISETKRQPSRRADARGDQGDSGDQGDGDKPQDTATVKKKEIKYAQIITEGIIKLLIGFKKATIQYARTNGTMMPGFNYQPVALGNDWSHNAPGIEFIFGKQPSGPEYFNREGWLTRSEKLNTAFNQTYTENINFKGTYEPFKDLKIELTADRTYSENKQAFYVFNDSLGPDGAFFKSNVTEGGSFTMSYIAWGTAFGGSLENEKSKFFENMKSYRLEVARRLAAEYPQELPLVDSSGFPSGYGPSSQYVLLPSFLAAYSDRGPSRINLNPMPAIPLPNWRISFNGLNKIALVQQYFKNVTLNHAYRCTYNVGTFNTNVNFRGYPGNEELPAFDARNPNNGDFYSRYEIGVVTLNEQFSPLINIDVTLHNSLMAKIEFKKSRNLSLSFSNNQMTEVTNDEITLGTGYRIKELPFTFRSLGGGPRRTVTSDLNLKFDFSIRNNKTVLRNIINELNQISAGQKQVRIAFNADYMISQSLTIAFYFDKIITNPYLPSQFRNSTTQGGFKLRFSLAQ
ncbi:MAG: cell surface protein SprA [Bacteroidales bacterium]|nr:cell surface protein SprA [Bacteroidales bacterium]